MSRVIAFLPMSSSSVFGYTIVIPESDRFSSSLHPQRSFLTFTIHPRHVRSSVNEFLIYSVHPLLPVPYLGHPYPLIPPPNPTIIGHVHACTMLEYVRLKSNMNISRQVTLNVINWFLGGNFVKNICIVFLLKAQRYRNLIVYHNISLDLDLLLSQLN